ESDPITLAKTIATLDQLSGGRVTLGAGFGWNTDELADHGVPAGQRRSALREYLAAMRAMWTMAEADYQGDFVGFGPSWVYPKPMGNVPCVIGAGAGPRTFEWIAAHADGWMTTPVERDITGQTERLRKVWAAAGRAGEPDIRVLGTSKPTAELLEQWEQAGVTEVVWGLPDRSPEDVQSFIARHAQRLGLETGC